jgi:hypothetical protein
MVKAVIDEKATGSSISSVSQTSIPTPCATSTRDEDFIWSSSLSDESTIVHLVDKAKADIATGSSISSGSQTAIPTSCATSSTDEDFIWSSSLSDDYVSESSIVHLVDKAKADITKDPELQVRLDVLEKELTEDIGKLNQRANMRSDDSSKRLQKYVDCIMAVFDDFATTTNNDKTKLSERLYDVIVNQFGSSYVKDLFFSYSTALDRDQLIFDLQLLRSYYFSDRLVRLPSNRSTLPGNVFVPHINTKRKLGEGSYEDYDTGDEVTYVDK